jgi:hypothetical protein
VQKATFKEKYWVRHAQMVSTLDRGGGWASQRLIHTEILKVIRREIKVDESTRLLGK